MDLNNLSSNWKKLQATFKQGKSSHTTTPTCSLKRKRDSVEEPSHRPTRTHLPRKGAEAGKMSVSNDKLSSVSRAEACSTTDKLPRKSSSTTAVVSSGLSSSVDIGRYVGLDCEMVGVGPNPDSESALARVSIVNFDGDQIYDSYVKPLEHVTDWRTHVSGILPKHMTYARSLEDVQKDVCKILQDRILVGHAIRHDLDALLISHPKKDIRDTARHPAYRKLAGGSSPRLKILASELLGLSIQIGEHSSIEDARACMMLFRRDKPAFEREHAKKWPAPQLEPPQKDADANAGQKMAKKKKKKKKKKKR